ncbi:MAG: PP2C family protein-serine/threonine phosphatase [Methanobacterium sp.]|nr:PP2C family protein-serine/threonine phosphatase [Methanobacterium sp.]
MRNITTEDMNITSLKSKGIRLVLCSLITFIFTLPFHYLFQIIPVSELRPASALPPAFGLLFGPWGAAGAALGNLASDIMLGYPPEILVIGFFAQFLYGYIPYKLWYTWNRGELTLPRLNTVYNLIKYVIIISINAFIIAVLLGFLLQGVGISNIFSFSTLLFASNNFDFCIILGTLIIIGANLYGIQMYKPKKTEKTLIPPKIFDGMLILAILIGIIYFIYTALAGTDIWWGIIAGVIFYLLIGAYVFKPVTREVKERTATIKISLTEKFIVIFIIIGAIIAIVTGIVSFYTVTKADALHFWETLYLNITLILAIFYASSISFLWYIEKKITKPIESISEIAKNYVTDSNEIADSNYIISKFEQYAREESEVGILAHSFQKMINDLNLYIEHLEKVTAEKERINTELNVARNIQRDMLPRIFPPFPKRTEFDIYATSIPAKEVGGDFYDFFLIDDNHLSFVIADVSGKGVPAALFMVITKTLIKNQAQLGKSPEEIFTKVNNQLYEGNDENMFVTAWIGILEIDTGKLTYANAGHNPPLLKRTGEDYNWLKTKPGLVLAGMEDIIYSQMDINLKTGDRIYLYTDGVTEATNGADEIFGDEHLQEIINKEENLSLKNLLTYVKEEIDNFVKDQEQFDDITMLVMEYKK